MNLVLEMFAGMGIFGIIFLIWFLKVITSVFSSKVKKNTEEQVAEVEGIPTARSDFSSLSLAARTGGKETSGRIWKKYFNYK